MKERTEDNRAVFCRRLPLRLASLAPVAAIVSLFG